MENSLFLTVLILSWLLCDVCVHSQDTCLNPGSIVNGYGNSSSRIWRRYRPGEKLTYGCRAGYFMSGSEHLTCLDSRKWDFFKPKCYKSDTCEPPGNISRGRYDPWKNSYEYGEKVEYKCIVYSLKGSKYLTCLKRDVGGYCGGACVGYWDNDPPECIIDGTAGIVLLILTVFWVCLHVIAFMILSGCCSPKVWWHALSRQCALSRERALSRLRALSRQCALSRQRALSRLRALSRQCALSRQRALSRLRALSRQCALSRQRALSRLRALSRQCALSRQRAEKERAEQDGSSSVAPAEPGAWTTAASKSVGAQSQEQSGVENSMGSSPGGTEISVEQSQASVENPTDLPTYTQAVRVKPARPALSQPEDSRSLPSYTQAIRSPTTRVPLDLMENAMEMRQWNTPTGLPTYTHAVRAEAVRPAVQSLPWDTHTTRIEISIDYDNFAPRNITSHQFEKDD